MGFGFGSGLGLETIYPNHPTDLPTYRLPTHLLTSVLTTTAAAPRLQPFQAHLRRRGAPAITTPYLPLPGLATHARTMTRCLPPSPPQALAHPYLGSLHDSSDEPLARTAF